VRNLYVSGLAHISANTFSTVYDYVALGHIHVPQMVDQCEHIRYSGSPIPMGYGEAGQQKEVVVIEFSDAGEMNLEVLNIPNFQLLKRAKGDLAQISEQMAKLVNTNESVWLEVVYTGEGYPGDLKSEVSAMAEGSKLEILRVSNKTYSQRTMRQGTEAEEVR